MPKIKFLDSVKNKKKSLVLTHTEEDIVLNLPKDSGILVTDKVAEQKVREHNPNSTQNVTFILKPDITENNGGVTTSNWDEYFKIASYRPSAGFLGKHTGTEWVAYSDSNLSTLVDRSVDNVMHKEKWKPNTNLPNLDLYVRYRFASNNIYSPWSDSVHVTTAAGGILPFEVSIEENTLSPVCSVSTFGVYGDATGSNHVSTSWVVYEANGDNLGNKVLESIKDTTNKMMYKIGVGKLEADKEYYLQVTLHTDSTKYPNSKIYTKKFITNSAYINRPVLEYKATNDSRHIIKASDFSSSDSSQSLVSAVWKLYDADNNTLLNSTTNTSKEYDITLFVTSKKKYYVTLVYKSSLLVSKEGKCVFVVKGSKADPITATFETSADKLPILKLSKFYVLGETDEVKLMAYKSNHKDFSYEGSHGWFNGKYNVPMEHNITRDEYKSLLDLEKEWDNSPLKLKAYIIGNKYNSEMLEATFTPDISLNYKVVKYGDSWDDFKIQIVKDDSLNPGNPTPGWIGFESVSIYGDKINTPINSEVFYHSEHTPIMPIPNNGYEYNKDYHFTFKIHNSIGIRTIEYTTKMEGGTITDPDMAIEAKHAFGYYVNMKVKGTEYAYSRPIDATNGLKEIKLTIQDTSDNNKVVYEQIQTVTDKGPAVYNFDINYDKDHLDKSLKHSTKYLISIEYKNKIGERSKRVSKEFTTLQRDELTIQDFEIQAFVYSKDVTIGGVTHMIVGNVILTLGNYDFKSNRFEYAFTTLHKKIVDENIEKMIVTIKALDGTTLLSKEILRDDLQKSTGTSYPDIYSDYEQARYRLMYLAAINSEAAAGRVFNNPVFKANNVYEISFALVKEDKRVEKKTYLPIVEDNRFNFDKLGTSRGKMLDNNPLRYELWKRTIINNPNLPEGTIIDANKAAELLKEHLGPVIGPKTEVLEISLVFNNKYSELSIVTDFKDPSKNKAVLKDATALEDFMPNPRLHRLPSDTNRITKVYDYNKLKPMFYVGKEGTTWLLYIKYVLFPKEIMHEDGYIHMLYRNGTYYGNIPEKQAALVQGAFDVVYEYTDPSNNKHILNIPPVNTGAPSISLINSYVSRKNMPTVWSTYLTTKEYIDGDVGLSDIPADNYKIYGIEILGAYNDKPYGSEFLEQIPYNGGTFILPLKRDLLFGNMTPLLEEDNLICQKDPLAGIHFKIYKINPDNTETLVPGIEDAFSAGVSFGIPDTYDILGKWTKPVNKRPVLEPGEKYRVKIWFVIANNFFFNDDWYVEKVFVAYKPSLNYKLIKIGDTWDDFIFQVVKDDSLNPSDPTPAWVTISKIVVSGDRIATPLESTTDKVKIPNNGYEYMQDYNFTIQVYTNAGTKTFNTVVRLDKGVIGTPDMTITTEHGRDAYINAKVVGSGYTYNMPINNTNDIKSIELTVYKLRNDGTVDHKVLDITQTVSDMTINKVYTFNLNYNKDNLSQSLKHNTNYQFDIVYENIKGEKSLVGTKKIKTPEREIIKPIKPTIHRFYIRVSHERDKNNKTIGTIDEYEVSIRNSYDIKKAFANGKIDKLNYTIKALDGTVVNNKDYTIEDYRAGLQKITDPSTSLKELSPSYLSYDFDNYISSLNRDFSTYQKPFKSGNVYECVVTTYYEDQKSSSTTYQLVRTGFADQFNSTLNKNMIDNLPLRLEYQYKTEIPNPGVASGSTIDISRLQELIRYCPAQDDPNLKLEEFTFRAGIYGDIDTFGLYIRTNFVDPSRNAAWVRAERIKDSDKYRTYGQGDKGSERVELSYADFKPIVKVIYENSKWYVILLYKGISRTLERTPNFLFPYGAGTYNDVFKIEEIIYKHYDINVTFDSTYEGMGNQDGNGSVTEWAWEIRPFNAGLYSDPKYPLITTEEYSKNQIPLSGVSSANYNITLCTHASSVRSISHSGPKHVVSYPYSTLEYLPINGCCLLMYIGTSYLTSAKVAEADNFLVQPHDKTGVHFQIYELKADGSEVLVEGAETAFSVGVYNGTGDKEYLGKWTKPVNKRKVLDHGKLYKLKFHFVPYNNATYASHFYVEKVFVGY